MEMSLESYLKTRQWGTWISGESSSGRGRQGQCLICRQEPPAISERQEGGQSGWSRVSRGPEQLEMKLASQDMGDQTEKCLEMTPLKGLWAEEWFRFCCKSSSGCCDENMWWRQGQEKPGWERVAGTRLSGGGGKRSWFWLDWEDTDSGIYRGTGSGGWESSQAFCPELLKGIVIYCVGENEGQDKNMFRK